MKMYVFLPIVSNGALPTLMDVPKGATRLGDTGGTEKGKENWAEGEGSHDYYL